MYLEGINKFLLSGSDFVTFGQVEQVRLLFLSPLPSPLTVVAQFTALFPDFLGLFTAIQAYLASRDELKTWRKESTSSERSGGGDDSSNPPRAPHLPTLSRNSSFKLDPDAQMTRARKASSGGGSGSHSHSSSSTSSKGKKRASSTSSGRDRKIDVLSTDSGDTHAPGPSRRNNAKKEDYGPSHESHSSHSSHESHYSPTSHTSQNDNRHDSHRETDTVPSTRSSLHTDSLLDLYDHSRPETRHSTSSSSSHGQHDNSDRASFSSFKNKYLDADPEDFHRRVVGQQQSLGRGGRKEGRRRKALEVDSD